MAQAIVTNPKTKKPKVLCVYLDPEAVVCLGCPGSLGLESFLHWACAGRSAALAPTAWLVQLR